MRERTFYGVAVLSLIGAGVVVYMPTVAGQAPAQPSALPIRSLTEPDQGFAVSQVSAQTGYVTFASSPDEGILLPVAATASAELRALSFVGAYGRAFGLTDSAQVRLMSAPQTDSLGVEHVRFQQVHRGVPVRAGEFLVHLRGSRAMAANGHIANDLPDDVIPGIPAVNAVTEARQLIEKQRPDAAPGAQYSEPRLEIFNRALLSDNVDYGSRLAWFVEATGEALREYIWVDAQLGVVLLNFSQIAEAKYRAVYNSFNIPGSTGTLVRVEGGPATGDFDADNAYAYSGNAYDYFLANHGRDSFDGVGGTIYSTVNYCPSGSPCPNSNAAWDVGFGMSFGDGWASADDIVNHEFTHGVTHYEAGLLYYVQSGALNESFSDIFGESVDLINGAGNDTPAARWYVGEDLPGGPIRDMLVPTAHPYLDPGKMSDPQFFCSSQSWTDPFADRGGVHTNSGIPNHAFALMVDGGTYNGRTITGIGLTKAAKIQYRSLSTYLTSGATFLDNFNALNLSCNDLIGTVGITAGDCTQVTLALQAVEMNSTWACSGAAPAPPVCPSGTPSYTSLEGFEINSGNWTATNGAGTWGRATGFAKGGTISEFGTNPSAVSDHRLSMIAATVMPAGARLYFDHAFEFENAGTSYYDGGVLEYSTDGGSVWTDAAGFIDAGQTYGGTVFSGFSNPLAGRSAFVKSSFGYTATRLNLAGLAGQSVKFRFRVGADNSQGSLGWLVDNIAVYTCAAAPTVPDAPTGVTGTAGVNQVALSWMPPGNNGGSAITGYQVQRATSPAGAYVDAAGCPTNSTTPSCTATGLTNGTTYYFKVAAINSVGTGAFSAASSGLTPTASFTDDPLVPGSTTIKAVHITELQSRIDSIRVARSLAPYGWTDPTLSPGSSVIRAVHIMDLRTALAAAYVAASQTPPTYTDPSLSAGTTAKLAHIAEIRAAVLAIE